MSVVLGKNLNHSVTEVRREMVQIVYIRPQTFTEKYPILYNIYNNSIIFTPFQHFSNHIYSQDSKGHQVNDQSMTSDGNYTEVYLFVMRESNNS